ncbi:MAG: lolA [Caulobacteraceae bacterium]|nr:lolA [Caulobacteraceae bacterium]
MTKLPPSRRLLIGLLAAALASPAIAASSGLSTEEQATVQRAADYLESIKAAKARFVQTDSKGVSSSGNFYMSRPGKARWEFDPPSRLLMIADGQNVSIINGSLQTQQKYAQGLTPLSLLLGGNVRFEKAAKITAVRPLEGGGFSITAGDATGKTKGSVTINFSDKPIGLIGWSTTDAVGQTVRVRLENLTQGPQPSSLFVIVDPRPTGMRRN